MPATRSKSNKTKQTVLYQAPVSEPKPRKTKPNTVQFADEMKAENTTKRAKAETHRSRSVNRDTHRSAHRAEQRDAHRGFGQNVLSGGFGYGNGFDSSYGSSFGPSYGMGYPISPFGSAFFPPYAAPNQFNPIGYQAGFSGQPQYGNRMLFCIFIYIIMFFFNWMQIFNFQ